ncbi:MAG: TetR family transcriptional regulator [Hydrocarboniphaga sp.]|uniref:TetR/AcrR family transcriptional regulator n=1 Tax=Hydrocarboniphaga sp. TaxID=2033016 RepID=UPI0026268CBB|nr:TetR/AcrR family transcriptional regulator [Hydrocarboniphaga sp.]MDB5971635.1 TetR family transcriptional regulator [Hydrocarboniphaga sp.]
MRKVERVATRRTVNRLSSDDRISDIMAAARAAVTEKGYEKVLISDIAERAGVVEGTIYRYFENKRDLLVKVAEAWFGGALSEDSRIDSIDGTMNKLRHLAWRTLSIIRREPVLARFMLMELRPDPSYRGSPFFDLNQRFTSDALRVCKQAIASGEFHDDVSAPMLRDMLFGCIEHRTWAFLRGEGEFSIDEVADGVAKVIYRGMLAAPAAASSADRLDEITGRLEQVTQALLKKT